MDSSLHDDLVRCSGPYFGLHGLLTGGSVLIPWFTLREVAVEVEVPSPKVAILRFERGMQQGLLGRISRTSVLEYHAFGIISEGRKAAHHYMICGVQGDFTRQLVADRPKTVWTRQMKFGEFSQAFPSAKNGELIQRSWRWPRFGDVQAWDSHLHGYGHRCSSVHLHPVARLVSDLDWVGSGANVRFHYDRSRQEAHGAGAHDSVGFQEKRRTPR